MKGSQLAALGAYLETVEPLIPPDCLDLDLIERVSDGDRDFFAAHPGLDEYVRPLVPGEFGGPEWELGIMAVLVVQWTPGARTRHPLEEAA